MNKVTLAAATIAFGASLAAIPAQADHSAGTVKKDGRCFVHAPSQEREGGFGYWGECPQAASISAAAAANIQHVRRPSVARTQASQ